MRALISSIGRMLIAREVACIDPGDLPHELEMHKARLRDLDVFEARIRSAHADHLSSGDYTGLGIAAQDALLELDRKMGKR